ncbi:serine hydrolase domain-containing protein [Longispora albida]|uniref:serine hydrolase domain-containing protein n=1 Tax=Longispora albida TaxID=203523 RepID=UPI000590A08E|nr:serine hydrolase domain-containing protein [Longispora albida]
MKSLKIVLAAGVAAAAIATTAGPAAAAATPLKPLDPAALQQALTIDQPGAATAALLRVSGTAGSWAGASGVADRRTGRLACPDDRFRIGSVTKVFTSAVTLQLAAEGKIGLDKPVQSYLPGLLPAAFEPISVGQLLNHTSGLPFEVKPDYDFASTAWQLEHRYDVADREEFIRYVTRTGPMAKPGTAQQYNGANYILAGLLIERVTGHSYATEVERRISRPLGLHHTSSPVNDTRIRGHHTHGYQITDNGLVDVTRWNQSMFVGEGNIVSTTADVDRFVTALLSGRLLPAEYQAKLFELPAVPGAKFSMGLMAYQINGVLLWGKTGSRPGYTNGVFGTADGQRVITYSVNTTDMQSTTMPVIVQNIAKVTF